MTIGELAQLMTGLGVLGNVLVSLRNGRKADRNSEQLEAVHKSTNGLSIRNEAIAKKLGVEEGRAEGLQAGRDESKS